MRSRGSSIHEKRRKRAVTVWLVLVLTMGLVGSVLNLSGCSESDRLQEAWREVQSKLQTDNVSHVEIMAAGAPQASLVFREEEAAQLVRAARSGTVYMDNSEGFGPTANVVVLFFFVDGTQTAMPVWPDGSVEIQTEDAHFLIQCPELLDLLFVHGVDPKVGYVGE